MVPGAEADWDMLNTGNILSVMSKADPKTANEENLCCFNTMNSFLKAAKMPF